MSACPAWTAAKRALYENLDNDEYLATAIDAEIRRTKEDDWRGHKVKGLLPGDLQALVAVLRRQKRGGANSAKIKPQRKGARSPSRCS